MCTNDPSIPIPHKTLKRLHRPTLSPRVHSPQHTIVISHHAFHTTTVNQPQYSQKYTAPISFVIKLFSAMKIEIINYQLDYIERNTLNTSIVIIKDLQDMIK